MLCNETAPTCHVFALKFIQTTTPAIRYWSHLVQHVSEFAGLLTMRTWVITAPSDTPITEVKGSADSCNVPRKCQVHVCTHVPYLHPCAKLSKCSRSYTIQRIEAFPSLSTCAFVYLFVSTHDCPPGLAIKGLWCYTYLHLLRIECCCSLNGRFKISPDPSSSNVTDPSGRALSASFIRGCVIFLRSEVDHKITNEQHRRWRALFEVSWEFRW